MIREDRADGSAEEASAWALLSYWVLIFVGTHVPAPWVGPVRMHDKVAHVLAFAGLAFLLAFVRSPWQPTRRKATVVLLVVAIYGALDEWTQCFVSGRQTDLLDWYAKLVGGVSGLALYVTVSTRLRRRRLRTSRAAHGST